MPHCRLFPSPSFLPPPHLPQPHTAYFSLPPAHARLTPQVSKSMIKAMEDVLSIDIPNLVKQFDNPFP